MSRAAAAALVLAFLGSACQNDITGPVRAMVVKWDADQRKYSLQPVRLATVTSLRNLRGGAGTVLGGGAVRANSALIKAQGASVDGLRRQLITAEPAEVSVAFSMANNVAYPEDLDSLQLVSAYANLEHARGRFNTWGLTGLPAALLVLGADVRDEEGRTALASSEMYFQPLATHYVPSPGRSTQVPLAMNLGAMAHSLAHQAAAIYAWQSAPVPKTDVGPARDPDWNTSKHITRSVTEGIADFMGAAVTDDAAWLGHSDQRANARSLDELRCSDAAMSTALPLDDAQVPYDPYPLGTVLAAVLWEASLAGQPDVVAQGALAVFNKLRSASDEHAGKLRVEDALDAVVQAVAEEERPTLCGLMLDRFNAVLGTTMLATCGGVTIAVPQEKCACPAGGCP